MKCRRGKNGGLERETMEDCDLEREIKLEIKKEEKEMERAVGQRRED